MGIFRKRKNVNHFLDPDEILADSISSLNVSHSTEGKLERPLTRFSHILFLSLISLGVIYLTFRAGTIQLKAGEDFYLKSQENRFLVRSIIPPRGIVYDQQNVPLVENHPSFGIVLEREEFLSNGGDLKILLQTLVDTLQKPADVFYEGGFPKDKKHLAVRLILAEDISPEAIVPIATRLNKIPGVHLFESFRRYYKDAYASSHLLGYVGKVSGDDMKNAPALQDEEVIGKSGLELTYDADLRGIGGKKIVEMDVDGHETRFKLVQEPTPGNNLQLTIDGALQDKIYSLIKHYTGEKRGASAVVIDPRSGAVRALVSSPGFDTNRFGYSLGANEFSSILKNPLTPLFNRAISGEFPSGSTLKPMIAAAALEEHLVDPLKKINDIGYIEIPNPYHPGESSKFPDWKAHGWINFYDAIAYSANVYFYMLGGGYKDQPGLGIDRIKKYALSFGLGSKLGIDLPGERPGLIPDPEWKKTAEPENPIWRIGDTYHVAIGQGGFKATPLQMTALTAAISNKGKLYRPYIVEKVLGKDGKVLKTKEPELIRDHIVSVASLNEVVKGMKQTVTGGTARLLKDLPVSIGAKTGTAQAGSGLPHAWVTVFLPADDPQFVMTVMVEHAGEGSTVAVPITHDILRWYVDTRILHRNAEEITATTTLPQSP